jgi:hypothetical protein
MSTKKFGILFFFTDPLSIFLKLGFPTTFFIESSWRDMLDFKNYERDKLRAIQDKRLGFYKPEISARL